MSFDVTFSKTPSPDPRKITPALNPPPPRLAANPKVDVSQLYGVYRARSATLLNTLKATRSSRIFLPGESLTKGVNTYLFSSYRRGNSVSQYLEFRPDGGIYFTMSELSTSESVKTGTFEITPTNSIKVTMSNSDIRAGGYSKQVFILDEVRIGESSMRATMRQVEMPLWIARVDDLPGAANISALMELTDGSLAKNERLKFFEIDVNFSRAARE